MKSCSRRVGFWSPDENIQSLENVFKDEPFSLNKIDFPEKSGPTFYKRPTPGDVLYEEDFFTKKQQTSFSATYIYEWNIDGMTDYQIMEQLHRMLMYASICKANGNNDSDIAKFIINGFTGVLYGWWHNSLNLTQKEEILSATRIETEGNQSSV